MIQYTGYNHSTQKRDGNMKLTSRQQEILDLIKSNIEETGYPPTRAEIAKECGFKSPNAAEDHLKALARKGAIEMIPGASRGIRVPEQLGLPLIGHVAAGYPVLAEEHIDDYCDIKPEFFSPAADFLLKVRGESMKDAGILDGDLLAVHKTHEAKNGQIVVARIDDELTVKRLQKSANSHELALLPENDAFEPIQVDLSCQDFAIEGIAVGVLRH